MEQKNVSSLKAHTEIIMRCLTYVWSSSLAATLLTPLQLKKLAYIHAGYTSKITQLFLK